MAANMNNVTPDTLITIKVSLRDSVKKLKLPLKDLTATILPAKLRTCLNIDPESISIFERYSDSVGDYVMLNENDVPVFKSLIRAAKAKGKLRLKCTMFPPVKEFGEGIPQPIDEPTPVMQQKPSKPVFDGRNLGSGIFQFRDARVSQQTLINDEAPVPCAFTAPLADETRFAALQACQELALGARKPVGFNPASHHFSAWSVYCNICDSAMVDAHYHCSICDGGDYDLCEKCVSSGKTCPGEGHWLIKRFVKDGKVVTSTTERVIRKTPEGEAKVPGAFTHDIKSEHVEPAFVPQDTKVLAFGKDMERTRTCNNCVNILPERNFVTCQSCDDFDLCIPCHAGNKHGHHPGHAFAKATVDTWLTPASISLLEAGRGLEHNAFCDGCDEKIVGIRHKCLQCPDWDYCNDCVGTASTAHPRHRFAALYEQLPEPQLNFIRHFGIYCDGPLCSTKTHQTYIHGVRYKCAVCHDTDLCAQCESLPGDHHNRTHPLIKFSTPVKNVNITTINEDARGTVRNMGDKQPETVKTEPINAPIPVQTVADIAPTEVKPPAVQRTAQPIDGDVQSTIASTVPASMLNAEFVKDTICDGTKITPGERFTQVWTLRNVGPFVWPAGCSVRYVGGDNMLNVDNRRPNSVASINQAIESSIVARDVQVGEEIAFSITLKAPMRPGKSISYWRLKAADGTPFGHRLWCDIDVRPQVESKSLPAAVVPDMRDILRDRTARASRRAAERVQEARQTATLDAARLESRLKRAAIEANNNNRERLEALRARILETRADVQSRADRFASPSTFMSQPFARQPFVAPLPPMPKLVNIPIRSTATAPVHKPDPVALNFELASEVTAVPETPVEIKDEEHEQEEINESVSSSQMVFPKLEKESPASSMIASSKGKAAYIENEAGEIEGTALPQSPISQAETSTVEPADTEPLDDDVEILSVSEVSEDDYDDDDGFLTDEEYDILDASDRETVHSP